MRVRLFLMLMIVALIVFGLLMWETPGARQEFGMSGEQFSRFRHENTQLNLQIQVRGEEHQQSQIKTKAFATEIQYLPKRRASEQANHVVSLQETGPSRLMLRISAILSIIFLSVIGFVSYQTVKLLTSQDLC